MVDVLLVAHGAGKGRQSSVEYAAAPGEFGAPIQLAAFRHVPMPTLAGTRTGKNDPTSRPGHQKIEQKLMPISRDVLGDLDAQNKIEPPV